jgi:hypothetical protein
MIDRLKSTQCGHKPYLPFSRRDNMAHMRPGMRMRRREFIVGLAMLADVGRASAQGRARRVGVLTSENRGVTRNVLETILKEKGWIVGQNLQIEYRITGGDTRACRQLLECLHVKRVESRKGIVKRVYLHSSLCDS